MKLVDVQVSPDAPKLLYRLLEERTPEVNISHRQLPNWDSHLAFIDSRPYTAWYLIDVAGESVGAIYLSKMNEIGVFLLRDKRGHGYGKQAIAQLMEQHPRDQYLANINPANGPSIAFFESLGFRHIQNTYAKR